MIELLFKKLNLKIFFISILFILKINLSNAEVINEFKIKGNQRLSNETIIMFSELELGKDVSSNDLNRSIKFLYETNYFKNIEMNLNNNILIINVEENPIIQTIKIEGIKNKSILESLNKITKKK